LAAADVPAGPAPNREEPLTNGKLLDAGLVIVWLGTFLIVAMAYPGLANLLIAWLGAVGLGWYNVLIRHDPRTNALRGPWQPRVAAPAGPDHA
jgi:hypothetical protein